jgi:hypothetical protein
VSTVLEQLIQCISEGNLITSDIHKCWKEKNNGKALTKPVYKYVPADQEFVLYSKALRKAAKRFYHDLSGRSVQLACAKIPDANALRTHSLLIESFRNKDFIFELPDTDVYRELDNEQQETVAKASKTVPSAFSAFASGAAHVLGTIRMWDPNLPSRLSPIPELARDLQAKAEWYTNYLFAVESVRRSRWELQQIYDIVRNMPIGYFLSGPDVSRTLTSTDVLPDNGIHISAIKLDGGTLHVTVSGHHPVPWQGGQMDVRLQIFRHDKKIDVDLKQAAPLDQWGSPQEIAFDLGPVLQERGCYLIIIEAVKDILTGRRIALIQWGHEKKLHEPIGVWGLKDNTTEIGMLWPPVADEVFAPVRDRLIASLGSRNVIAAKGSAYSYLGYRNGSLYAVAVPTREIPEEISRSNARYVFIGTGYCHQVKVRKDQKFVNAYDIPIFGKEKIALPQEGFHEIKNNCLKMLGKKELFDEIVHFTASNPYLSVKDLNWDRIAEIGGQTWKFREELGRSPQKIRACLTCIGLLRAYDLYPYVRPEAGKELPIAAISAEALGYRIGWGRRTRRAHRKVKERKT